MGELWRGRGVLEGEGAQDNAMGAVVVDLVVTQCLCCDRGRLCRFQARGLVVPWWHNVSFCRNTQLTPA